MNFKHYQEPEFAIDFLANHLIDGTLVLFLGAGTSRGFGLPDWKTLANEFRKKVNLAPAVLTDANSIQNSIDEALDKIKNDESEKQRILKEILYPNTTTLDYKLAVSHHLLIAISSLLIGSKRGHIKRVVSFNYDSLLEWFLGLFGFSVRPIINLPALEGSEDVRIYHPHGFAPHPLLNLQDSTFLVLGSVDAKRRAGDRNDIWFEKERQLMETGVCLFIGMSGNTLSDVAVGTLLQSTGDAAMNDRPLGIWLSFDKLEESKKQEFFRSNIVPIELLDEVLLSEFVLKISQKALEKQKLKKSTLK